MAVSGGCSGIYTAIPSKADVEFGFIIEDLVASDKGSLFFGVIPVASEGQSPPDPAQASRITYRVEGESQPIVVVLESPFGLAQYIRVLGRYLLVEKGVAHKVTLRVEETSLTIWLDGNPLEGTLRLAPSNKLYFWIGYDLSGQGDSLTLVANVFDLTIAER